jgi:hypothetical protein
MMSNFGSTVFLTKADTGAGLLDYELCSITLHYNPNVIVSLVSALRVC